MKHNFALFFSGTKIKAGERAVETKPIKYKTCLVTKPECFNMVNKSYRPKLYINFVDFEKAFDSVHRNSLWKILRHYGIPQEIVSTIQSFYNNFNCRVGNSQHSFPVLSGVRQGCVMSALLFNITIDWVMRQITQDKNSCTPLAHTLPHPRENQQTTHLCKASWP